MSTLSHDPQRRTFLTASGVLLLAAWLPATSRAASLDIEMSGTAGGATVWFRPRGLHVQPGQTVRWVNRDTGNVHTVTAYHPDNGKPLRIPAGAKPWNSGYLMPGESFSMVFDVPGVYDYYCVPHEHAGMVGRIVVGDIKAADSTPYAATDSELPAQALKNFADVKEIIRSGSVP